MRTTISIDDNLLKAAKSRARRMGLTLGQLVEGALRRELGRPAGTPDRPAIPVFAKGTGLRRGVDAGSTRSLLEALERGGSVETHG